MTGSPADDDDVDVDAPGDRVRPLSRTVTLRCPQDPGLRGLRNSVVAYRLMNAFDSKQPFLAVCDPAEIKPASSIGGGAVTCTSPESFWPALLEVTCCLN